MVTLSCSVSSNYVVQACKFATPEGHILLANHGVGQGVYAGASRLVHHEFLWNKRPFLLVWWLISFWWSRSRLCPWDALDFIVLICIGVCIYRRSWLTGVAVFDRILANSSDIISFFFHFLKSFRLGLTQIWLSASILHGETADTRITRYE